MALGISLLQNRARIESGKIARGESQVQAQMEELSAVSRERDRKGRLADALASQNAAAGAKGIAAFEGSPLTILNEDIRRESVASERDKFQSRLSAATTRARGLILEKTNRAGANLSLFKDVVESTQ